MTDRTVEHEVSTFYSDIFNQKQDIFFGWQLWNFSEENLNSLVSQGSHEKIVDKWITKELKALLDNFYVDETFDSRRFVTLYRKGMRCGEIRQTPHLQDSLYFVLKGMFQYSQIQMLDKNRYLSELKAWANLFFPNSDEGKDRDQCILVENELNDFKRRIESVFKRSFEIPYPQTRSYEGFVFAANFLFECLRCQCPARRENQFAIFSLLTFKSLLNLCFKMPFEYPILRNIACEFNVLKDSAVKQKSIADGDFLNKLFRKINSEFESTIKVNFSGLDKYKVSGEYIKQLTQDFSHDKLHGIARRLSDTCGDDCNGLIYSLLKQAAAGLVLSERCCDKEILTSLLEHEQDSRADSDLPLILYLIASGLNSYSYASDCAGTQSANEAKKRKK